MNVTDIEWCDMTWNPVTGCLHDCPYCYAKERTNRFQGYELDGGITTYNPYDGPALLREPLITSSKHGKRRRAPFPFGFDPTMHTYRLDEPMKKKSSKDIFVCSMSDLFGEWVHDEWIEMVFNACRKAPQHRYLFLTKNPKRYTRLMVEDKLPLGENIWYGATVTDGKSLKEAENLYCLSPFKDANIFMSVEPLLGEVRFGLMPDLVIVGAETGSRKKQPPPEMNGWVQKIYDACRNADVPIFMKDSLAPHWDGELIKDLPWRYGL